MELHQILEAGVKMGASDIHLSANTPPLARVNGDIMVMPRFETLNAERCKKLVYSFLYEEQRARFEEHLELDCSVSIPDLSRFRVNVLMQRGSVEAVFRVIPPDIPLPQMIGLGPTAISLCNLPRGLVLVTGPTGCGKSTTLACLIEQINLKHKKHIVTIEDPIEFIYERKNSLIRQREVGRDTHSFEAALRHALREDPDVILVGEMRDLETISLILTAAETGHLCFGTLHTLNAAQTVDRIIDVFPPHQQQQVRVELANSLKGVVSQILLPRKTGQGRVAAREMMVVTPAISNLIREMKTHMITNVIETGGALGMFTMDKALAELVHRGIVHHDEALARAQNRQSFLNALSSGQSPASTGQRP